MSSTLKMLHSDISPSKDNLIFSSMEDLPQLEQNPTQKVNKSSQPRGHNRSLSQSQIQKEVHIPVQSHPDIDALFQARTKQQQNLLLAQERERKNKGILKRELEDKDISEGIEEVTVTSDPQTGEEEEGGSPQVVGVQDEVEGSGWLCCWGVREKRKLDQLLRKKQDERAKELSRLQTLYKLEGDNKRILNLGWEELVQALQKRELSATAVLEAYISKTLEATTKFNNVTEFIPQAFVWAKELDSLQTPKGPLHGIPFCVKDDTNVEGLDTTLGYAKRLFKPAEENAVLVKSLMDLGAIPFCKTNVPQTLFSYGSDNPVFGATTNCFNPKLSPGGSSSGTGSLVGSHGCPFGTGTDIGGSLRIPAHFNGVASIKPTVGRLSDKGVVSSLPNLMGLTAVPGVIGQTPTIVSTVFKGICEDFKQHSYDTRIPPIPWDNAMFTSKEKLRIGYFSSLPFFPAMGDTEEVVLRAKSTLESLGHTLVPFHMPDEYKYMNCLATFLMADGNSHFYKSLKGEKLSQAFQLSYYANMIPTQLQRVIRTMVNSRLFPFMHSRRMGAMMGAGAVSSKELWDAQGEKTRIVDEMHAEWERLQLDAVVCPLFPFPAPLINYPGNLPMAVCYAMIWNLVDFPAGVVPFGRETGKNYDNFDDEGDVALKLAKKAIRESIGAPIGVQCVALPYKEEIVLRLLTELEQFSYKH